MERTKGEELLDRGAFHRTAQTIIDQARTVTGATRAFVAFRLPHEGRCKVLRSSTSTGRQVTEERSWGFSECRLQPRLYSGSQLIEAEVSADRVWLTLFNGEEPPALRNVLLVPFVAGGRVVGLLGLANKEGDFTARDVDVASSFAEFASMALHEAGKEDRLQRTVSDLRRSLERRKESQIVITVCALCHRHRDETGAWQESAVHIAESDDLSLSHGLCEECARVVYGVRPESTEDQPSLASPPPVLPQDKPLPTRSR